MFMGAFYSPFSLFVLTLCLPVFREPPLWGDLQPFRMSPVAPWVVWEQLLHRAGFTVLSWPLHRHLH